MKKIFKILIVFISTFALVTSLTSCNAKPPSNPTNTETAGTTNTGTTGTPSTVTPGTANTGTTGTPTTQTNGAYTKEFPYLPAYPNMEFQSVTQPDQNQLVTAKYLIKHTTTDKVLKEYGDILTKDGWALQWSYANKQPNSIYATKDKHMVVLVPEQKGDDVQLIIGTK